MRYISTRGRIEPVSFCDAVMMGLADDGGLLIPDRIPDARDRMTDWRTLRYADLAFEVMRLFADDLPEEKLRDLIDRSYGDNFPPEVAPLVRVGDRWILELFHGPTLAFKDVALQFLGNLFEHLLQQRNETMTILGATSGDTGSAAIHGVRGRNRIEIFVMHPWKRVSPIQERQMTTVLDANVHNIGIDGTFDDCQRIMKDLFSDVAWKRRHRLGAVNSVNWARVLAQVVYYFWATFRLQEETGAEGVQIAVPTGNFGNVLAGWYAARMGAPIRRLILATNENDILSRFYNTHEYVRGAVNTTLSPSMDIQVASNFERYLYYRVGENAERVRELMQAFSRDGRMELPPPENEWDRLFVAGRGETPDTLELIRATWQEYRYLLDPHSAVGVAVADKLAAKDWPVVCLATAHPAKFPAAIEEATGEDLARHPEIDQLHHLPTRCEHLPDDLGAVRDYIERTLGG